MKKPSSVAVLPFPLTAAALFGYGILRFLGYISETTHIRFTRVSSKQISLFDCADRIVYLNCDKLYLKILDLSNLDRSIKRMLTFAMFGNNPTTSTKTIHSRMMAALTKLTTDASRRTLHDTHDLILWSWRNEYSTKAIESFVIGLEKLEGKPLFISYPPDQHILSLPRLKKEGGISIQTDGDILGSFEVPLPEGRIFDLVNRHICVVIGGPPNSGKSTLAVSLVAEMQNCIRSLKTRASFSGLQLSVGLANLDLGTPTAQAISEQKPAWDKKSLQALKRPWTMELGEEGQGELLRSRAKHNIVIGDLPGTTNLHTRLLAGSADACILISNDWGILKSEWQPFMASMGLPCLSRILGRQLTDGFSSLVTNWRPGESLNGRIVGLNRSHKSWDVFIQWLTLFLLFDILPTQFDQGS